MDSEERLRFRRLRWLTIVGPTGFMMIAESVRYLYLRHQLPPLGVSLIAILVTLIATGVFSRYVFGVVWHMEQERNAYRESVLALSERERLAREMHDGLAQDLATLKLQTYHLQGLIAEPTLNQRAIAAEINDARALIDRCYTDVRQQLYDLRASARLTQGFWKTLASQLRDFERQTSVVVEWADDGEALEPTDPRVAVQLLRIVQEALSNVRRHAHAHHLYVDLRSQQDSLVLSIRDDGLGVGGQWSSDERHYGLVGMQERAKSVGATVHVGSVAGESGTMVQICWPADQGGEVNRKEQASVGG